LCKRARTSSSEDLIELELPICSKAKGSTALQCHRSKRSTVANTSSTAALSLQVRISDPCKSNATDQMLLSPCESIQATTKQTRPYARLPVDSPSRNKSRGLWLEPLRIINFDSEEFLLSRLAIFFKVTHRSTHATKVD